MNFTPVPDFVLPQVPKLTIKGRVSLQSLNFSPPEVLQFHHTIPNRHMTLFKVNFTCPIMLQRQRMWSAILQLTNSSRANQ